MTRNYTMRKRADAHGRTRERIVLATMQVHDEKGVARATLSEIAVRAGVGLATVSRHFPTYSDLVQACGTHVWEEMRPPVPEAAAQVFAGLKDTQTRLARLVQQVDAFYARGALRLRLTERDRELMPELHGFLTAVEAGIAALVREALALERPSDRVAETAIALMSFPVWLQTSKIGLSPAETMAFRIRLLQCGLKALPSP